METDANTKRTITPSRWISIAALLLSVTASVAVTMSWLQTRHRHTQNTTLLQSQTARQQQLSATVAQLQSQIQAQQTTINTLESHLGHSSFRLKLTQIAANLNLANLQLTIHNDSAAALKQLQLAQATLNTQNDARLLPLQRAVALDIQHLSNATQANTNQLISQLDALAQAIQTAPLVPQPNKHLIQPKTTQINQTWLQRLWGHLKQAQQLVVIRHQGPDITPLLAPSQQQLLRTLVQSRLLLCEYAVIRHNNALFHHQLNQIKTWIQTLLLSSTTKTYLLKEIKALQQQTIQTTSANLNHTIDILTNITSSSVQSNKMSAPDATTPLPAKPSRPVQPPLMTGVAI